VKYAKEFYDETEFYGGDEDLLNHQQKIVKVRKEHYCCNCGKIIEVGKSSLCETGFLDGQPQRAYTCVDCLDKWLDEIYDDGESE